MSSSKQGTLKRSASGLGLILAGVLAAGPALAVQPNVSTVPWVPGNPLIPHDTWSGNTTTLKCAADVEGANFEYTWDFGDGSPVVTGTVTDRHVIEATHAYTGSPGDIFTAKCTVEDTNTGETDTANYFVEIQDQTLDVEVNAAIDEGLWYLHKRMNRSSCSTAPALDCGTWESVGLPTSTGFPVIDAANATAFLVNGHSEGGSADNPYTDTVQRGMRRVFEHLERINLAVQNTDAGSFNPDTNGNGFGLEAREADPPYQGGMFMDAIVATGTPNKVTETGSADVIGRSYAAIVQDMADAYAYGQSDTGTYEGGWRYSWYSNSSGASDNSTNQWAAIGMIAGERTGGFNSTIPPEVKTNNVNSINNTQNTTTGVFGYTNSTFPIWGPYAVTPSGMVQMVWNGIGRGDPRWDRSENFMRDNFCNEPTSSFPSTAATQSIRSYYYGLFSFTKSMLLHDSNGDGVAEPITDLANQPGGANPLDWYEAQASQGDACDGVARTLVDDQAANGSWNANNYSGSQYPFETAWSIIMLNRTVFEAGQPVAVAAANPNPGIAGQTITLDGTGSFHQNVNLAIVQWEWDIDNDGQFDDAVGPTATTSFPAVGDYPVGLRVTDNNTPAATDTDTVIVRITTPPIAPTADANGPYVFCPQAQPWFLDGSGSTNPDEGLSEPGQPGDTIQDYAWELNSDGGFDDASGANPDVTAFFTAQGTGDYLVQLRVTDTTSTSFPSSNFGDLSDTDSAQVSVRDSADPACADCVDDLTARAKDSQVQLVWSDSGAASYNVYRSTTQGGPYAFVAKTTSTYSTYLDTGLTNGTTYYYVVRPAAINNAELCQSNEASGTPAPRRRRR